MGESLHKKLQEDGFHKAIIPVRKAEKEKLVKILNEYRGVFKAVVVDGSEIGEKNIKYLPKNISNYYVVYVKDIRDKKK